MLVQEIQFVGIGWGSDNGWSNEEKDPEMLVFLEESADMLVFIDPDTGKFYGTDLDNQDAMDLTAQQAILAFSIGETDRFPRQNSRS